VFFDKFKELCDIKGVSCNKAITDIGLSNSTATKWKKTGAFPNVETLIKIAIYFDVSPEELMPTILSSDQQGRIVEVFDSALREKDLTCSEAVVRAGCKFDFFPSLKNRSLSIPPMDDILRVATFLEVEDLVQAIISCRTNSHRACNDLGAILSSEESDLLNQYRSLDQLGRNHIKCEIHAQILVQRERLKNARLGSAPSWPPWPRYPHR